MATVKTFLMAASCGMILLGAVSAQAELTSNKLAANKLAANKLAANGISLNAITPTVPSDHTLGTPPSQGLTLNGLSQRGLGKRLLDSRIP